MARVLDNQIDMVGQLGGLTLYQRNGKTFVRLKHINQPRRLTRKQLAQREQLAHNNALWRVLKKAKAERFEGGAGPYYRFMAINHQSPTVYLTKRQLAASCTLLLPQMAVSDGPLPPVGYRLGEIEGTAALLTDLPMDMYGRERLLLYELCQTEGGNGVHRVSLRVTEVQPNDVQEADGCMALINTAFADERKGWALVREKEGHVSTQRVVTRCSLYEMYTTEEALQAAAESYGGLTT